MWLSLLSWYIPTYFCRFVVLIIDEMKIREDLVYDKTGERLHGFVNLDDINDQLRQLEKQADSSEPYDCFATQMLTLMVRGVFIKLEFPYASFPTQGKYMLCTMHNTWLAITERAVQGCTSHFFGTTWFCVMFNAGVTGQMLYWIMWEAVRRLEELSLKVTFYIFCAFSIYYASFVSHTCTCR